MTDRIHSLTVVFDKDIRTDDVQPIINAIKCLKGVIDVNYAANIANVESHMAEQRAKFNLQQELWDLVK